MHQPASGLIRRLPPTLPRYAMAGADLLIDIVRAGSEVAAAAHEREPGVEVDAQAVEDRGEVGGDGAALVAAHDAAGSVHQRQVFIQLDGVGEGAALRRVDGDAAVQVLQM